MFGLYQCVSIFPLHWKVKYCLNLTMYPMTSDSFSFAFTGSQLRDTLLPSWIHIRLVGGWAGAEGKDHNISQANRDFQPNKSKVKTKRPCDKWQCWAYGIFWSWPWQQHWQVPDRRCWSLLLWTGTECCPLVLSGWCLFHFSQFFVFSLPLSAPRLSSSRPDNSRDKVMHL